MAETRLAPVAGAVAGRALTVSVTCRCRVAGGAVREIRMAESDILLPANTAVTVRTLPRIVICRTLVAHLTIHERFVVWRILPAAGDVAQRASAFIVPIRYHMAGLAIR